MEYILNENEKFHTKWYDNKLSDIEKAAITNMQSERISDEIIPICFLYRQYIELRLKIFYLEHSIEQEDQKVEFLRNTQHNLLSLYKKFEHTVIKKISLNNESSENEKIVYSLIEDFHQRDSTGIKFRYGTNFKGQKQFQEEYLVINVVHLRNRMQFIKDFFDEVEELLSQNKYD